MIKKLALLCFWGKLTLLLSACETNSGENTGASPPTPIPSVVALNESIEIRWNTVDEAIHYNIYWSNNNQIDAQTAKIIKTGSTQFLHQELENNKTYYYKISAVNYSGESATSPIFSATPKPPPSKPAPVSVQVFDKKILVSWNDQQSDASSFDLFLSDNKDLQNARIYTQTMSPFEIDDLNNGNIYYVATRAYNPSGPSELSPVVQVVPSLIRKMTSGFNHNCALKTDQTVWCWGRNHVAQIGHNSTRNRSVTVPLQASLEDPIVDLTSGAYFSCAIHAGGHLWCWGGNERGQLGTGSLEALTAPYRLEGNDWRSVAAGAYHVCAIKNSGSLWCWGWNQFGQIGSGNVIDPANILQPYLVNEDMQWKVVAPGGTYTCAIASDNSLWCWGNMQSSEDSRSVPSPEKIGDNEWISLGSGDYHACAIKIDQTIWCWGYNSNGQIGRQSAGNFDSSPLPAPIETGGVRLNEWISVQAGSWHSCGIKSDFSLWCWGYNGEGQLGDGTQIDKFIPNRVDRSGTKWASVSARGNHTCAATLSGIAYCWGSNRYGELGRGERPRPDTQNVHTPSLIDANNYWRQTVSGFRHSCALRSDNALFCWGDNKEGQLGDHSYTEKASPTEVAGLRDWKSLFSSANSNTTCALKFDNTLWCWGRGEEGQLGPSIGSGFSAYTPEPVKINDHTDWETVSVGYTHICATKSDNTLWCWGKTLNGRLGFGAPENLDPTISTPTQVDNNTWLSVTTGDFHTCGVQTDNTLWCWGRNDVGQLGIGNLGDFKDAHSPQQIGSLNNWLEVSTGEKHSCAKNLDGNVFCWGNNTSWQVSDTNNNKEINPIQVEGDNWQHIVSGYNANCGLKENQALWCWGVNSSGELGTGNSNIVKSPTLIAPGSKWLAISVGDHHSCGLRADSRLWCWGSNLYSAIGDGITIATHPQLVQLF